MKREIIPAILAKTAEEALAKFRLVPSAAWVQIDGMDGAFVKNRTWFDAKAYKRWEWKPNVELHLMVEKPEPVIRAWKTVPTFKRAIWHVELPIDHAKLIRLCRRLKIQAGLAINPETPVAALVPFLRLVDTVLVMGVHPGWSGQKLLPATIRKADAIRALAKRLPIGFDGGATARHVPGLLKHGVTRICMASSLFQSRDPDALYRRLQKRLR